MDEFVKGDVVVLNFPFSDLSGTKRRPALVLANLDDNDIILCQITSRASDVKYAVRLGKNDFEKGSLSIESAIRPNKIFTADKRLIAYVACKVTQEKLLEVVDMLSTIIH